MQKGTMYMVRPRIQPSNSWSIFCFISLGSAQLFVGPASFGSSVQIYVQPSTRATSRGSDRARKLLGRFCSFKRMKVPPFTIRSHSSAYSSSVPVHQCTEHGWHFSRMANTHVSRAWLCTGMCEDALRRPSSLSKFIDVVAGSRSPNWPKYLRISGISFNQPSASTCSSSCICSGLTSIPATSRASLVGRYPIGVGRALPTPSTRSVIHFSTREFSPNPGQMNWPFESWRNQFT
mmetsp:Transcript_13035/g.23443  ORF Transcript_13035/g.23443 Transcript_13035/m.23443 type:complete len:234 (+) Transcript_13035:1119-1820(+)